MPNGVALDQVTNKIYVSNAMSNDVTVIEGSTNSTTSVGAGVRPAALAVNPTTHKIYVTHQGGHGVTVINGLRSQL